VTVVKATAQDVPKYLDDELVATKAWVVVGNNRTLCDLTSS